MTEADAAKKLISDIGKQLNARETCPKKDFIVKLLRQAASAFPALDQTASLKSAIKPLRDSLIKHNLLQHRDKDVRLLVAISCCEVIRVLAPNPDFSDAEFRDIFKLFLSMFEELGETTSPYFSRRAKVLETVAKLKFCVLMLDTGCDDLVIEMFNTFFTVVREHYPQSLITAMVSIMTLILKDKVSQSLLDVILQNLLKEGKGTSPASSQLAVSVIQNCTEELEPYVCRFLTSCISERDATGNELKEFYHEIIFEIFQCAPQMLLAVIPTLAQELLTDQVDVRIKAVNLIGRLFALPGHHISQEYRHLFIEFLKRFSDKSAEVRLNALLCAKALYMTNPAGRESLEILTALEGRLLDFDDRVRIQAVSIVCDLARSNLKCVPVELISRATERLRDKKVSVRKRALQKLLEVYRDYCTKCSRGIMISVDHFEQIPCRILMLCYDKDCKDFRPQGMELVIAEDLFPSSLPIEERTTHWVSLFSLFSPPHIKALNTILSQKRRLQTEMQAYLALRRKEEENSSIEMQKRIETSFAKMSASFPDPSKAEECFRKLHVIKDNNIFDALSQLLDDVTIESALTTRDGFLEKIGDKHPQYGFLQLLSTKCSYNIFSSDHVHWVLNLLSSNGFENKRLEASSVKLLLAIINVFPSLLRGSEKLFQLLLKEDIPFNEELIQMIAKCGPQISIKLSDIYPSLKRVCLEGTRSLSKLAVSAIAALVGTSEKFVYSELCKTLVDSLKVGMNIPTVLQSLGCMAQHSVSTFEAQEEEITQYINEKLFKVERSNDVGPFDETSGCSHSCTLKIYGLKALVKSFLPHQGIHVGRPVDKLLYILSEMLQKGDVFDGTISSEADKAHIRLAAAKSVLRLSRRWDLDISPQIFRLTVLTAKDSSSLVRRLFVDKVDKLLKEHAIPSKYACAFAFVATDSSKDLTDVGQRLPFIQSVKYMEEFIREYGREARKCQTCESQGGVLDYPAYMVVYLVHVLAHDVGFPPDNCQDEELYARLCSPLVFTLQALVNASLDEDVDLVNDAVSNLRSIFHAIKKAEDAVNAQTTTKLHILADFGISIVNALDRSVTTLSRTRLILLPSSLYRLSLAEKAEPANLHTNHGFDENIVKRMVHSVESQISRPASNLAKRGLKCREDHSQSDVMNSGTSNLALCRNAELLRNGTREQKGVSPITGKEQLPSSCDSVATKASLTQKEDLICSASLEENEMGAGVKNGVLIGQRIKLWSPIDECYYLGTVDGFDSSNDTHKIAYDSGEVEVVSLESENWEAISDDSLWEKDSTRLRLQHCDPLEPSSLSSQRELAGAFSYDASNQQENLPEESGSFVGRKISRAVKEKKEHKVSVDTSTSEVINVNMDAIARRTRKRKA